MNDKQERYEYFLQHEEQVRELQQLARDWGDFFAEEVEDVLDLSLHEERKVKTLKERTRVLAKE
jgi:hypothetical protein